jgi:hypothetical protein
MQPETEGQSTSPLSLPEPSVEALDGSLGEEAQEEALWHLLETQINLTFDAFSFISDGSVRVSHGIYLQ